MKPVISIENVSKAYRMGTNVGGRISFKRTVLNSLLRKESNADDGILWALSDINLVVNEGDCIGLLGKNGSGKSTLLKIINRVTAPTTDWVLFWG